jgi:hypothetical protein
MKRERESPMKDNSHRWATLQVARQTMDASILKSGLDITVVAYDTL